MTGPVTVPVTPGGEHDRIRWQMTVHNRIRLGYGCTDINIDNYCNKDHSLGFERAIDIVSFSLNARDSPGVLIFTVTSKRSQRMEFANQHWFIKFAVGCTYTKGYIISCIDIQLLCVHRVILEWYLCIFLRQEMETKSRKLRVLSFTKESSLIRGSR